MIKKSEKLVCAYITLISRKYSDSFVSANLFFTDQELVNEANELFDDTEHVVGTLDLQNATKGIGNSASQKLFVKGSSNSLNNYYRFASPYEVPSFNLQALVRKLSPHVYDYLPQNYANSQSEPETSIIIFLNDYFNYVRTNPYKEQEIDTSMKSPVAVWIAAATLTYNEFIRTNSSSIEQYLFSQNSIARLAFAYNPQSTMATYSQVTGQMVTHGKNEQQYSYLFPYNDKRRIAATSEALNTRPELPNLGFQVTTIDGTRTVQELSNFISGQFTSFVETGSWPLDKNPSHFQSSHNIVPFSEDNMENMISENIKESTIPLNTVLYGPPGTGKTYHTVLYSVAIIENKDLSDIKTEKYIDVLKRYNEYKSQGRIEFTTFHQSYGYEEFIEGIKPAIPSEDEPANIQYSVQPGLFKKFCDRASLPVGSGTLNPIIDEGAAIWKVSLQGTGDNEVRSECLKNGHIRIGWDGYGKDISDETDFSKDGGRVVLNAFINRMQIGDVIFSCYSASTIDAIGIVIGDYEWHPEYKHYCRLRKVKWLIKDIRENILDITGGTAMTLASVYRLSSIALSDVYRILEKYKSASAAVPAHKQNYVFIIDEINRGNISKIFGELITLIESSKRVGNPEGMQAILPYSQRSFGVPSNVYIIGTMNTADRSIAAIDTALRRRFTFKEMLPDPDVLDGIIIEDLSIRDILMRMNQRISVLYDREHTIGHAYFMPLREQPTIETLASIFKNNIIPLLQEYFYEDYEKIRLVLGDNQKSDEHIQFIVAKANNYSDLFGNSDIGLDDGNSYEVNKLAISNPDAYRFI